MNNKILLSGALLGFTGILLGAFGAHGLEKLVSADNLSTFETGVKFQMYQALAMFFLGMAESKISAQTQKSVFILWLVGIILFSGSIYGLATNDLSAFDFKKIALITPLGGTLILLGWGWLAIGLMVKNKKAA